MKIQLLHLLILIFAVNSLFAQIGGAAINNNGAPAHPSALLDVSSTTQGTLITRMTTVQRNNIVSPAEGLMVYNLDCHNLNIFSNGSWIDVFPAVAPAAPSAGINSVSTTQIIWNWNTVITASGYKWNTTNNYSSAIDLGLVNTITQSGLFCNTLYTIYVWAYNSCGVSLTSQFTELTTNCPVFTCGSSTINFTYNGSPVTYGTVQGAYNGGQYCWLDRNLGAQYVATASNDYLAYGDLFQWGRGADGHQLITWYDPTTGSVSSVVTTLSNSDSPGHSSFIRANTSPSDWRSPQNASLWQGLNGTNNPCPTGFRVPNDVECDNERLTFSPLNAAGGFASPLKLTTPGARYYNSGALVEAGSQGYYWTSTINGTSARFWALYPSNSYMGEHPRANAWTIRCIKDY